eukprot:608087-Rhodomonas_salina.3
MSEAGGGQVTWRGPERGSLCRRWRGRGGARGACAKRLRRRAEEAGVPRRRAGGPAASRAPLTERSRFCDCVISGARSGKERQHFIHFICDRKAVISKALHQKKKITKKKIFPPLQTSNLKPTWAASKGPKRSVAGNLKRESLSSRSTALTCGSSPSRDLPPPPPSRPRVGACGMLSSASIA